MTIVSGGDLRFRLSNDGAREGGKVEMLLVLWSLRRLHASKEALGSLRRRPVADG